MLYQLQQRLGNTAIGHQTWLALDLQSHELVVIKLLAFSPEIGWKELELFEREAQILQELNHPKIPKYRDYFEIDRKQGSGVPWFALVQDYILGNSLQELLDSGKRFSEDEIRLTTQEVLEVLIYLHELNPPVLHRDIKPSNLILGENNTIYLVDFGAVQAQASMTGVTFSIVGTGGYAPLEQFYGRATVSSDLYALGATIIHLSTGISPINLYQGDRLQFRDKINLQSDLIAWLEKVTDAVSKNRFESAKEALEKLKSRIVIANSEVPQHKIKITEEELELLVFFTRIIEAEHYQLPVQLNYFFVSGWIISSVLSIINILVPLWDWTAFIFIESLYVALGICNAVLAGKFAEKTKAETIKKITTSKFYFGINQFRKE